MKKIQAIGIANQTSFKEYLNRLFADAVSNHGTTGKSINEILLEKAVSYGRAINDAKEDVKRILNVRAAVGVLLKSAASNMIVDDTKYINNVWQSKFQVL